MRFCWISIFLAASLTTICSGTDMDDFIDFLNKNVPALIGGLKMMKQLSLGGKNITFQPGPIIEGHLNMTNVTIFGLDNINTSVTNFVAKHGKNESYAQAVVNLPIANQAGLSLNYDMDLGIFGQIPLYGKGEISINIAQLNLMVSTQLLCEKCSFYGSIHLPQNAEDLNLNLFVKHKKPYITGMFLHPEVSSIITSIMNIVEQFVCMWFDYNAECLDCIVSPIIERVLNKLLDEVWADKKDRGPIKYDCACLKTNFTETHRFADKLNWIIEGYETLDIDSFAQNLLTQDFMDLYTEVLKIMKELIKADEDIRKTIDLDLL